MGNSPDSLSLLAWPLPSPATLGAFTVHSKSTELEQPKWKEKKFLRDYPRPQQITQAHGLCVL